MTIVTHAYRPKRARKRNAQAATIAGPMIVTAKRTHPAGKTSGETTFNPQRTLGDEPSAIVTARKPGRRSSFPDVPDMTPEEHKRRGDAADPLFREMKRQIAASKRS